MFLLASMCFLVQAGGGPLGGPPLLHPGSVGAWFHRAMETGPSPAVGAGFAALLLLTMAVCGYLLSVTLVSLVAHGVGWSRAAGFADRRGPRVVSVLVRGSLGLTLSTACLAANGPGAGAASLVAAVSGPPAQGPGPGPADRGGPAHGKGDGPKPQGSTSTTGNPPVLEWVGAPARPPRARSGPGVSSQGPASGSAKTSRPAPTTGPPSGPVLPATLVPATWTVGPGDSFWSIATAILQTAWGRAPTDAEVDPYWSALVAANRAALLHPDVPDLIYPGQSFVVPAPPASGTGG